MRRQWRALLVGIGVALAAAGTPTARGAEEAAPRLAEVHLGSSQEGPSCPSTAELQLVHSLEATEAALNAKIAAHRAPASAGGTEATQTGEFTSRAGKEPLEVALAEVVDMQPDMGTAFLPSKEYPRGTHHLEIVPGPGVPPSAFGELPLDKRPYLLYVPEGYRAEEPIPLWIQAPGTDVAMETVLSHNAFLADRCTLAMVVLSGLERKLSVGLHAQASRDPWPDDVAYTRAVLREVMQRVNVDTQRVRCVGFSRGGRFCSRLASELAGFISAIAAVSGIRYPEPNNATRPLPVLAIHGEEDEINPFKGGLPPYWGESVMASIRKWAENNNCRRTLQYVPRRDVQVIKHTDCTDGADVVLVKLLRTGHEWPSMGTINARVGILQFFSEHASRAGCHTVTKGDADFRQCDEHVDWAMRSGIFQQPGLYGGLTSTSSRHDFQLVTHRQVYADCPEPCREVSSAGELFAVQQLSDAPLSRRAGSVLAVMAPLAVLAVVAGFLSGRLPLSLPRSVPSSYRCMGAAGIRRVATEVELGGEDSPMPGPSA